MNEHVCPWWMGYLLVSPLRRILQDPVRILSPFIKDGMEVLDVGSAMGFFSLPMARLAGEKGRVICVDLQEKMLSRLKKRASGAGFSGRVETRLSSGGSLGIDDLEGRIDFALLFAVVHEIPDAEKMFGQLYGAMKPGGRLLMAEPERRVSIQGFNNSIAIAESRGFGVIDYPDIKKSHAAVFRKR